MKTRKILVCGLLVAIFALAFVGCETEPEHVHDWGEWDVTLPATCIAKGVETRVCKLDGSHKETRDTDIDTVNGHNWGEWEDGDDVELEPTCENDGIGILTCVLCNAENPGGVISALGHDWDYVNVVTKTIPPTCIAKGSGTLNCKRNGCEKTNTDPDNIPIDPDAHDAGTWHTILDATCVATGTRELRCTLDQAVLTPPLNESTIIPIDPTAHDAGSWHITLAATCIATGTRELRCTLDNAVLTPPPEESTTIAIDSENGHLWNTTYTIKTAATDSADGEEEATCQRDGSHTHSRTLYATGTAGLVYDLISINDGADNAYRVHNGGVTTFTTVRIPAYWRGNSSNYEDYLPVTTIGNGTDSFTNTAFGVQGSGTNSALTTVIFLAPSQITTINDCAFYQCRPGYSSFVITLPESLTTIGVSAFGTCSSLRTLVIPAGVTSMGNSAFADCYQLSNVTISPGVTTIGYGAFYSCDNSSFTRVTIPASVTSIDNYAFGGCTYLTRVTFSGTIVSSSFNAASTTFLGNLRAQFYATDPDNGTPGTYIRSGAGTTADPYVWALES
jgi:hypothetical protein